MRWVELTSAEQLVVEGVLRGAKNSEIARERGTSERTIANQVASAYKKLGVGSRLELARLSMSEPLADRALSGGAWTTASVGLKPRELVVLGRRLQGDRLCDIAAELGLSVSSASRLAQRAVVKLGARSVIELSCQGLCGAELGESRFSAGAPCGEPG